MNCQGRRGSTRSGARSGWPRRSGCSCWSGRWGSASRVQRNASDALRDRTAALMGNHGAVVVGSDLTKVLGQVPYLEYLCDVQLRAHGMTSPATVSVSGDDVTATLSVPQTGVAAGQALVMYDGDTVLGSATITAASLAAAHR